MGADDMDHLRKRWSDGATQSCAHWLNWKCGIAMGAAREKVRVARALESLPKICRGDGVWTVELLEGAGDYASRKRGD